MARAPGSVSSRKELATGDGRGLPRLLLSSPLLLHTRCHYLNHSDRPARSKNTDERPRIKSHHRGTSLVVHRSGIHLPVLWTMSSVPGPGRSFMPWSTTAAEPALWATCHNDGSPGALEPVLCNKGSPQNEHPMRGNKEQPLLAVTGESPNTAAKIERHN